jgi:hypothetical protein
MLFTQLKLIAAFAPCMEGPALDGIASRYTAKRLQLFNKYCICKCIHQCRDKELKRWTCQ